MFLFIVQRIVFFLLLAAGVFGPGWLLGRALRTPAGPIGSFLGSAALLTNLMLALDALGLPLRPPAVAAGLAVICGLLGVVAIRRARAASPGHAAPPARERLRWGLHHALFLSVAFGFAAIAVAAILEPASGLDAYFRWDFLARQMLHEGTLRFYPSVTDADFLHYGWPDGIAPLIATLYFWGYLCLGRAELWTTAPLVLAQAALLYFAVWQLAARRAGPAAGSVACAILSTSSVALWGVAMGQETGLTALAFAAMILFLERAGTTSTRGWFIWAGVAAGTGALAREYGLAFIALGWFALEWRRVPRGSLIAFMLAATAVALPWYARNALLTGNPVWSHSFGSLLPSNPVLVDYYNSIGQGPASIFHLVVSTRGLATLVLLTGLPLSLAIAHSLARRREEAPSLVALGVIGSLWLWSIGQTSGGYVYSLRVLTPALALGAALGGAWLAPRLTRRGTLVLAALFAALAVEAGARSLYLPFEPAVAWWHEAAGSWRLPSQLAKLWRGSPDWQQIADAADGRRILVADPACHALFVDLGAKPVPLFSPGVHFLTDPATDLDHGLAQLRRQGYRFIVLTRGNSVLDAQLALYPFFRALQHAQPAVTRRWSLVYDLYASDLKQPAPTPPAAPPASPASGASMRNRAVRGRRRNFFQLRRRWVQAGARFVPPLPITLGSLRDQR